MIRCVHVLLCILLFFPLQHAFSADDPSLKKLQELQEKIKACGSNIQCLNEAMKEIQNMNLGGNTTEGMAQEFLSTFGQSIGKPWMVLQKQCLQADKQNPMFSCLPVKVTVSDAVDEQAWDYTPSGILPHPGTKYLTLKKVFSYAAEGRGKLLYKKDFSSFYLIAAGTPETTRIQEFNGYEQWYESVGSKAKQVLKRRDFVTSGATIHNPFQFSLMYPFTADTPATQATKNFKFDALHVLTHDKSGMDQFGSALPDEAVKEQMVTPSAMKQFIAAKGFQRTYRWRFAQPNGMEWVDHLLTIKLEIGKGAEADSPKPGRDELPPGSTTKPKLENCRDAGSGRQISLTIVTPQQGERFTCSAVHPTELIIEALATVDPPQYADQITWSADSIGNVAPSFHPSSSGYRTTIMYEGLPSKLKTGEYGPYRITASVNVDGCVAGASTSFYYHYGDCCAAKADIEEVMKLINAFKDQALLQQAEDQDWSAEIYRAKVYEQVFGASAGEGQGYESPMETDPLTCNIRYNWSKQDYKNKGYPDYSFEADNVHEQFHQKSCQEKTRTWGTGYDAYVSDPRNLSREEIGAYTAKLNYLKGWVEKNCR